MTRRKKVQHICPTSRICSFSHVQNTQEVKKEHAALSSFQGTSHHACCSDTNTSCNSSSHLGISFAWCNPGATACPAQAEPTTAGVGACGHSRAGCYVVLLCPSPGRAPSTGCLLSPHPRRRGWKQRAASCLTPLPAPAALAVPR